MNLIYLGTIVVYQDKQQEIHQLNYMKPLTK